MYEVYALYDPEDLDFALVLQMATLKQAVRFAKQELKEGAISVRIDSVE
jgi:hypothetical protein